MKGIKFDAAKPRYGKVLAGFAHSLTCIGDIGDHGGKKYEFDNWKMVDPERYADSFMRHYLAHLRGEGMDESGMPHLGHAAWNILALLEHELQQWKNTDTSQPTCKASSTTDAQRAITY